MPLYEYECDNCGHRFEVIQKFSDAPIEKCPKCGGPVHKLQSAPAFHLKGTGWYITDYGKKDQTGTDKSEGGTKDSKESAAGSKETTSSTEKSEKTEKSASESSSTSTTSSATQPSKDTSTSDKSSKAKSAKDKSSKE
jgi:putative FmdB family regulatory protein